MCAFVLRFLLFIPSWRRTWALSSECKIDQMYLVEEVPKAFHQDGIAKDGSFIFEEDTH